MRTIAFGLVIDHWRCEKIERAYLESIARMLEVLKPKVRQAFLLAQCEGLTHKHIAEQMGLSLRSVERCVRRRAVLLMSVDNAR